MRILAALLIYAISFLVGVSVLMFLWNNFATIGPIVLLLCIFGVLTLWHKGWI